MVRLTFLLACIFYHVQALAITCKPVVAVYPTWKHSDKTMQSLPWDRYTHIAVFGIYPNSQGNLLSENADKFIDNLTKSAHSKGKKVIVSIGGAADASKAFRKIAENQTLRVEFAKNVNSYIKLNNLDGIDIDWEYWTFQNELRKGGNDPVESKNLVAMLAEIRRTLPKEILLTADIVAGNWLGEQYLSEIEEYVDYVNLMAFDFTGQWDESPVSHHSEYSTFKKAIEFSTKRGFTKEKLLIGLPAYGKEFVGGRNKQVTDVAYAKIVDLLDGEQSKISKGRHGNIYFETKENVTQKSKYVQKNEFAGVFFFEVTSDHAMPNLSLLHAASKVLNPDSCYNKSMQSTANASAD